MLQLVGQLVHLALQDIWRLSLTQDDLHNLLQGADVGCRPQVQLEKVTEPRYSLEQAREDKTGTRFNVECISLGYN